MKIGFFGTPSHAAKLLEALYDSDHEISFIVTNIDKPFGRDKKISPSPVKVFSLEKNLPLLQFESIKTESAINSILQFEADLYIVFAYGHIIPEKIFNSPRFGTINLHGSLLPEYRGASPVQAALLDGKKITGISIQYVTKELDAGDLIQSHEIEILEADNSETLLARITEIGIDSVLDLLNTNPTEKFNATPQDISKISFCKKIKAEDRKLNFTESAESLWNKTRAYYPQYIPYANFRDKRINFHKLRVEQVYKSESLDIGALHYFDKKTIGIQCGDSHFLILESIQPENKKVMSVNDFINGSKPVEGEKFS
jgi:methionyl-tRNA formyltransferase